MEKTKNQFTTDDIPVGQITYLEGIVQFSHITSKYDGNELAEYNKRQLQMTPPRLPEDKPFAQLQLSNIEIRPTAAEPQMIDKYLSERLYQSTKYPEREWCYTIKTKGQIPSFAKLKEGTQNEYDEFIPESEFASGTKVIVQMRCYHPKTNDPRIHNGLSIDAILFPEGVQYYEANRIKAIFEQTGIKFNPLTKEEKTEKIPDEPHANDSEPSPGFSFKGGIIQN